MALLGFEGFDHFGATAGVISSQLILATPANSWLSTGTQAGTLRAAALSASGFSIQSSNQASSNLVFRGYSGTTNAATLIAGCRFSPTAIAGTSTGILQFMDGASTVQCGLLLNPSKQLLVICGATTLATGTTVLNLGSTYFIEFKVTFATGATGSYEARINGITEVSGSGVITTTSGVAQGQGVAIANMPVTATFVWDDMYLCDGTGSAPYNTFLASSTQAIRVETVFPTSNNSVVFTPAASTNVSQIQETAFDGDATYNYSTASGDIDTFNHGALASTPATVFGVQITSAMRKDDVTVHSGRNKFVSGATTSNGTTVLMLNTYQMLTDLYINDPNTAGGTGAWTGTTVNATKIGYEHV